MKQAEILFVTGEADHQKTQTEFQERLRLFDDNAEVAKDLLTFTSPKRIKETLEIEILIIEDEVANALRHIAHIRSIYKPKYIVVCTKTEAAKAVIRNSKKKTPDLVVLDFFLNDFENPHDDCQRAIQLYHSLKENDKWLNPVVLGMSAYEGETEKDYAELEKQMRSNGDSAYNKGNIQNKELAVNIFREKLAISHLRKEAERLKESLIRGSSHVDVSDYEEDHRFSRLSRPLIGESDAMKRIKWSIELLQGSSKNILLRGETGTGKEQVARAIHEIRFGKERPFEARSCANVAEGISESELFGHVKGAFTGAIKDKKGIFELGNGGTVMLDEIGEAEPWLQSKLLRVIQERVVRRLGDSEDIPVNFKLISATHKNLEEMVRKGTFREDLYYRINEINVIPELPPLRERKEDIISLAEHILESDKEIDLDLNMFSRSAINQLKNHHWRGNIRSLKRVLANAYYGLKQHKTDRVDESIMKIILDGENRLNGIPKEKDGVRPHVQTKIDNFQEYDPEKRQAAIEKLMLLEQAVKKVLENDQKITQATLIKFYDTAGKSENVISQHLNKYAPQMANHFLKNSADFPHLNRVLGATTFKKLRAAIEQAKSA